MAAIEPLLSWLTRSLVSFLTRTEILTLVEPTYVSAPNKSHFFFTFRIKFVKIKFRSDEVDAFFVCFFVVELQN